MLRFGPTTGPVVIAALPLFEEANRTRSFVVSILRALAERGIGGALPDLPGTGESVVPTETTSLTQMRAAFNAAADALFRSGHCVYALAVRSGALIDTTASVYGRWHLAPQNGKTLLRELARIGGLGNDPDWWSREELYEIAGNRISTELLSALVMARPFEERLGAPLRVARHQTDQELADIRIADAPLWRRAEPTNNPVLGEQLADDIADWIATCGG